ncbi:MAG: ABC transporter ATP-binding protein [Gammaproteobacteria bacterium]|jgi:putative ABC transport system ATP-binding protein
MIELRHIHRRFQVGDQQVHALNDVTLTIERGEYVSIMGPSGSGKSTLLHALGLLDRPDSGTYLLENRDVTALSDQEQARIRSETIGFVFQFFHLVPRLSAADNIGLPLLLAGVPAHERQQRVARALAAVNLADRAEHRPEQLSGGQRQRVAIARATIMRPSLILADEPTGNLDHASGQDVIALLEKLHAEGLTLIIVTHDGEIGRRARRCVRMLDGRITEDTQQASAS